MASPALPPAAVSSSTFTHRRPQRALVRCSAAQPPALPSAPQRVALAAAAWALTAALGAQPAAAAIEPVYFGNGCFWGRQKDFIDEEAALGRQPGELSAVVGYAAGKEASSNGKVCYYYTPERDTIYERLGHAEVTQVELVGEDSDQATQFEAFAKTYFQQFRRLPDGRMLRLDPQDAGPGYRNVVGIPGGTSSPLYKVLQDANVNGMRLLEGQGGGFGPNGKPLEGDLVNAVWVVDSRQLPFFPAEQYHQFHSGLGERFPESYTKQLKQAALDAGRLKPTGCPEYAFMSK